MEPQFDFSYPSIIVNPLENDDDLEYANGYIDPIPPITDEIIPSRGEPFRMKEPSHKKLLEFAIASFIIIQITTKVMLGAHLVLQDGVIAIILTSFYWTSVVNSWANVAYYELYKTRDNRYTVKNLIGTFYPYGFFLDFIVYLGIPFIGSIFNYDIRYNLAIGVLMSGINVLAAYIVLTQDISLYDPITANSQFTPLMGFVYRGRENQLEILAWKCNKIVIANNSKKEITGALTINRSVYHDLKLQYAQTNVEFCVKLNAPLKPGATLTFIPETYRFPGAYTVKGYRSFGMGRCFCVQTTVAINSEICTANYDIRRRVFYASRF